MACYFLFSGGMGMQKNKFNWLQKILESIKYDLSTFYISKNCNKKQNFDCYTRAIIIITSVWHSSGSCCSFSLDTRSGEKGYE